MQLASTYGAVSFDEPGVLNQVARAQRAERAAKFKTYLLHRVISLPLRQTVKWCVTRVADALISHVDKRTGQLVRVADALDSYMDTFKATIAEQHRVPSEQFIDEFERLHQTNVQLVILCSENVDRLRSLNPNSRVALAFERMRQQVMRIDATAVVYLEWGRAARDSRAAQFHLARLTKRIDDKLENYDTDSEIDPVLMAHATKAVARLEQN